MRSEALIFKMKITQINVEEDIKKQFEKERMLTMAEKLAPLNQSEFTRMLLVHWRTK